MRRALPAVLLALAAAPAPAASGDLPMVAIGLPFAPETPHPVAASHPLYHRVEVAEIDGLPVTVGSSALNFIAAAKRSSINAALRETFARMNLLAPTPDAARVRLAVAWGDAHTPFRIATHNRSTATLHYRLTRIDSGQVIFERDVATAAEGGGSDASLRDIGTVRAAIAANFASAANCLDRAATGIAPADCALTPRFSVVVARRPR